MSCAVHMRMKSVVMSNSITIDGCEYPINTNVSKEQGCYVEILEAINRNLMAMLSYHSRVLVIQFIVHRYDYPPLNTEMSALMKVLQRRLPRKYQLTRICGGWVREVGKNKCPHYHVAFFLDGNRVCSHYGLQYLVTDIATFRDFSRPSFVPSHMVVRGDFASIGKAFYHLSYLAKTRDKNGRPPATNDYSFSRPDMNPKAQVYDVATEQGNARFSDSLNVKEYVLKTN